MAQIIKHRRGSISALKDVIANVGELVMATGSIGDFNGPVVFVGDTAVAGGYKAISKIYQGPVAPSISVGSHGSTMDGVPYYSTTDQTLYILDKSGNSAIDLTGNIEGNVISGVTINTLTGTNANITSVTGSNGNFTYLTGTTFTSTNSNITSLTSSVANVTTITGGTLTVTGKTYLNDNLNITGDIIQTGSFYTTGDIVLRGNINIGDNLSGDIVNINAEISSSLIPSGSNVFDLGSPTNFWNDLYVSGTANVNVLNANTISLSGITVFDDLVVSGSSYLGQGGGDQVIVSGSMYLDSLTEGRVVYVGPNSQLVDNSSFTFDGSNLQTDITSVNLKSNDYSQLNWSDTNYVYVNSNGAYVESDGGGTYLESYDGQIYLNNDSGNEINMNGETYVRNNHTLYGNRFYDESTASNMLELYGNGLDNGYWWESGNNQDTTLWNSRNGSNLNILQTDSGKVNISAPTVNLSTTDGFKVTGSIYNSSLTNNRVVIGGVDGLLEDDANFTFDASVLKLGQGKFEVDVADGDIRTSGSLLVKNTGTVSGSLSVDGHINLTNEAQIRVTDNTTNTLYGYFDGSNILGSYYQMFGNNFSNAVQRGGAEFVFDSRNSGQGGFNIAEFNGTTWSRKMLVSTSGVSITGTTTLNGDLIVTGTTQSKGAVGINSTLDVTGSATFKNNVIVSGTTTISGDTYVQYLVQNRVLLAGANGHIEDNNNLVFDTNKLQVGMGKFEVDVVDGDIRTSGSLTVEGGQTINGDVTVNGVLTVTGNTQLQSNLYVSGNLEVLGSSTNVNLESHTVNIGDNIILLNAYSPFNRYAGVAAYDSGSSGVSGSMLWDSLNDYWMFVSASGQSSKFVGTTAGTYGSEVSLTSGTFPIATASNTIGDSLLTYSGTTLALNTNKFTVDSSSGDTLVTGNFTLSYSGGTDNNSKTSAIMFRNSSNVVGFVTTTETTDVLDGILGYKHSNGGLVFSTVIDGGTY